MNRRLLLLLTLSAALAAFAPEQLRAESYEILFNGRDLAGWKGLDEFWTVRSGSLIGETTAEHPTSGNTFLVWQGGEVDDFEFLCQVRFQGNNSGVQYRSRVVDPKKFVVAGYQADLHPSQSNFGMLYGEKLAGRGIIAGRGQRVRIDAEGVKQVVGRVGDAEQLVDEQWNVLRIVAVGNRLIHQVNGVTTVDVEDLHADAARSGVLALQLHQGPPMKVEFRNLRLRKLAGAEADAALQQAIRDSAPPDAEDEPLAEQTGVAWLTSEPRPQWIWHRQVAAEQALYFRKSFELPGPIKRARIYTTCDNRLQLWVNGKAAGRSPDWPQPIERDITALLKPGTNLLAAEGKNAGGTAAFVCKLQVQLADGKTLSIVSDPSWKMSDAAADAWQSPEFDDSQWSGDNLRVAGALGVGPWNIPKYTAAGSGADNADPLHPKNILAPPGFVVDRIYSVPKEEQGSWVSLGVDPQGRLYASDQGDKGLYRITVPAEGDAVVEKIPVNVSGAQGLLWAFDSLWVHRNGGNLHRLSDSNNDGTLDQMETQPSKTGGGEHGNHAVILTEDGKAIYMAGGNHAAMADLSRSRVTSWGEDLLLPRMWDARGHARGILAPGGWVTRFDTAEKTQELYCVGFRNEYDIALNRYGDMFTFDADMEWDMGMPWYRPTRICHVVSGGDYGWRSGSGKWPTYYEDSLPPAVDIGPGSPTGVAAGIGAKFPARYQDAIYALDWTFGTMYAIHLTPDGASYRGESEPFVYGSPLPLTDAVIGADGAMYFTVGGRGAESALFRVRYVGDESTAPSGGNDTPSAKQARELRQSLEKFHGRIDPAALDQAWPHLKSPDRFLRHAARVAVESQPAASWATRVFQEPDSQTRITAAVALARRGEPEHRDPLLKSLLELDVAELPVSQQLGLLRAYGLISIRLGAPTDPQRRQLIAQLDPQLPSQHPDVNTELILLLTYLRSPSVVAKAMDLIAHRGPPEVPDWTELASRNPGYGGTVVQMLQNHPPSRELGYAFTLRNVKYGWTLPQRRAFFEFLNQASKAAGGASFPGFLTNIRTEALGNCSNEERKALEDITGEDFNPVPDFEIVKPQGPGRKWTVAEAAAAAGNGKPDLNRGRSLFFGATCGKCHRHAGLGGGVGPDLTSVPNKFDRNYVVEATVNPSKDISDQYSSSIVVLESGEIVEGLVVELERELEIHPLDVNRDPVRVAREDVVQIKPSRTSQMPQGLLDSLNAEEVRDLIGYLMGK